MAVALLVELFGGAGEGGEHWWPGWESAAALFGEPGVVAEGTAGGRRCRHELAGTEVQQVLVERQVRCLVGPSVTVPNILLVCGEVFDAWPVPRQVGSRALDLLPDDIAPFVPVAMTPTDRWHLFTTAVMPRAGPIRPSSTLVT
jgi:hypothetical protein